VKKILKPFYVMVHPIEGYEELFYHGWGSGRVGFLVAVLYFLTLLVQRQLSGFIFNSGTRLSDLNVLYLLAQSIGLFFLFSLINWALCTLFDGKGRLKGIWIASTYALMPMLLTILLSVVLSNILKSDEAAFIQMLLWVGRIWTAFLLVKGIEAVHQYTLPQTFLAILLTGVGMLAVMFIFILLLSLSQQIVSFLVTIVKELMLRGA
jgi:hypothetical protein